jgi:hypothetical protein
MGALPETAVTRIAGDTGPQPGTVTTSDAEQATPTGRGVSRDATGNPRSKASADTPAASATAAATRNATVGERLSR